MRNYKTINIVFILLTCISTTRGQRTQAAVSDTSAYSVYTEIINGKKYIGFLNDSGFFLINSRKEIVVSQPGYYFTWELKDLNADGRKDIFLDLGGNTPERYDLLLCQPNYKFKKIENFESFPAPIRIVGTKYYYSYHKSGCADMNWGSDLFYILNSKAIRIGSIAGYECQDSGIKDGIYVYTVNGGNKKLKQTMPVQAFRKYKDLKWGFIADYWNQHWKDFTIR